MKSILISVLLFTTLSLAYAHPTLPNPALVSESGLTAQQAEQVLRFVLVRGKYGKIITLRGAYIEGSFFDKDGKQSIPGFYTFRLAHDSPKVGATDYFGPFVVSQKTATVWDVGLGSGCKKFESAALARLEVAIIKKTKAPPPDENILHDNFDCLNE